MIFTNSFNLVTQANGTLDSEWPVWLGCAIIDRSLGRMGNGADEAMSKLL